MESTWFYKQMSFSDFILLKKVIKNRLGLTVLKGVFNPFLRLSKNSSSTPSIPQSWGKVVSGGTPPDPRQEVSCTSFITGSKVFLS